LTIATIDKDRPGRYVGWMRSIVEGQRVGKWIVACEADGYWACWDVILANELPSAHCELVVLRKGIAPTGRAK